MRIAVVNEVSAGDRNGAILKALEGRGHSVHNLGMADGQESPQLLYTHTGFISALVLNLGLADLVVGGCGTGVGYLNSVMQFPGVTAAALHSPLDAWLFGQINAGNCVSLALNQGFGWAGDVNLGFIFDRLFSVEWGSGYPEHRREPQRAARGVLAAMSSAAHRSFPDIIAALPEEVVVPALTFPRLRDFLALDSRDLGEIGAALKLRLKG